MIVTLEQARAMRWPFRNPRQPMGLLLDQGTIAAPDLQRASRAAYSPRFKAACLMLLHELALPVAPAPAITRSVPPLDQLPVRLLPNTCPICESKLQVDGSGWTCLADRTHYWLHRVQRLQAARQQWIDSLSPTERQYHDEIWLTASEPAARDNFLIEHALKYPAGS
jgi:hypothetical protein